MKVGQIAFRFRKDELEVLTKILKIGLLPGIENDAAVNERQALQSLIDDGFVQPVGEETMLVDRTVSLILMNAAAYERCILAVSDAVRIALFQGKLFSVILTVKDGIGILSPIQEWEQACRQFIQEAERLKPERYAMLEQGTESRWMKIPQDGSPENIWHNLSIYSG